MKLGKSKLSLFAARVTFVASSLVFVSCGGGGSTSANGATPEQLSLNLTPSIIATDNGKSVYYLTSSKSTDGSQTSYWGTVASDGTPTSFAQSLQWKTDPSTGIRTQYDLTGRPVVVTDLRNGAFLTVTWQDSQATIKFYQPNGAFVGAAIVTVSGSSYTSTTLPSQSLVGAYSGSLTGLTAGVVSFALGSTSNRSPMTLTARGRNLRQARAITSTDAKRVVASYKSLLDADTTSSFSTGLVSYLSKQFGTISKPTLAQSIFTNATKDSGQVAPFLDQAMPLLKGLGQLLLVNDQVQRYDTELNSGKDLTTSGTISNSDTSPVGADYATAFNITPPNNSGDSSFVQGIAASREYGAIPLKGILSPDNSVEMTGTLGNVQMVLKGHVTASVVTDGSWSINTSPRSAPTSGSWTAQNQPFGQCQQQQLSGNQGIFTNTYDLGVNCGSFNFEYETYTIPDRVQMFYEGQILLDTGVVGEHKVLPIAYSGSSSQITVVVTADLSGTAWYYIVGCPDTPASLRLGCTPKGK